MKKFQYDFNKQQQQQKINSLALKYVHVGEGGGRQRGEEEVGRGVRRGEEGGGGKEGGRGRR